MSDYFHAAVELKFFGEANVQWSDTTDDNTIYYSNNEIYLNKSVTIVGGSGAEITLPPGIHTYPFTFILPWDIPSSFEGIHGYVRYTVKAAIRRSGRFDHHSKSAFTILCPLDLNNEPDIMKPVRVKEVKKLFFGLGSSPIILEASLPFSGYVPGQKCQADLDLENRTTNSILLKAYILQIVTLKAKGCGEKIERKLICREVIGELSSQGSMKSSVGLQIPAVPDSFMSNCEFIDISYTLQIKGHISGMHRAVCVSIPIVIGSIPLRAQFNHLIQGQKTSISKTDKTSSVPLTKEAEAQSTSAATSSSSNILVIYPEITAPSYEECNEGTNDIRNEEDNEFVRGAKAFTPRYPVYSFKENQ